MTKANIQKAQDRMNVKFETAKRIRELLDEAKKTYGAGWDDDGVEAEIIELVTEE